jgi:hypothetical protein
MFTDDLFQGFETICNILAGLWYGQEDLGCPAQLCTIKFCADTHLYPTAQSTMKVSLAAQSMSHTVAAGLNALVAAGKDQSMHCMLVMKWLIMRTSFQLHCPQNADLIKRYCPLLFLKLYQYTSYVEYVANN